MPDIRGLRHRGRAGLLIASSTAYVLAFAFDTCWSDGGCVRCDCSGFEAFLFSAWHGWSRPLLLATWFANPILWAGWAAVVGRRHEIAGLCGATAFAVALLGSFAVWLTLPGKAYPGFGWLLWLGSIATLAVAPFLPRRINEAGAPDTPAYPVAPLGAEGQRP